jgi:regulator of PEP synthase PpsR (kinase-PPPase family)
MPEPLNIFIVSDATGATAEAVVTSSLVQFSGAESNIRRFPFVRTEEQVDKVLAQAPERACIIVFTFVSRDLTDTMMRRGQEKSLTVVDVMSPLMGLFSIILEAAPSRTPGAFRGESEESYLVTEAIDYTLKHDDGAGVETLDRADLIILGVSRTGKTPTSIFLSCKHSDRPRPPFTAKCSRSQGSESWFPNGSRAAGHIAIRSYERPPDPHSPLLRKGSYPRRARVRR